MRKGKGSLNDFKFGNLIGRFLSDGRGSHGSEKVNQKQNEAGPT